MRRLLLATIVVAFHATGCGRSGPLEAIGGPLSLTVSGPAPTAGTISFEIGEFESVCPPACGTYGFDAGTEITLEANEQLGDFRGWSGDAASPCGTSSSCSYRPRTDQNITADFVARLVVTSSSSLGAVTSAPAGIACPGDCQEEFLFGTTVTLTAVPSNSFLQGWGGACAGDPDPVCSVVMDEYRTAVAWFSRVRIDLYGTSADEWAEAIAADPLVTGGYVLAGSVTDSLVLGSALVPHTSGQELFVARFGADRRVTWLETIGGGGDLRPHALAVSDQDGVLACYVGGSFEGDAEFDGANAENPTGDVNGFVSKHLDEPVPVPTPEWWETFTGNGADNGSRVADLAFQDGRVALTGLIAGQVTLDGTTLGSGAQDNRKHAVDAVFSSTGVMAFAVQHGKATASHAESAAILFSPGGATLSAGFRDDVIDDGGPCTSATNPTTETDAWFYQLSADASTCSPSTLTLLRPTGENRWSALAGGPAGAFLAAGFTRTLETSVTVSEYSAAGTLLWTRDYPASAPPGPFAAAYDASSDQWVLAGSFDGNLVVGGVTHTAVAGRDIIVFRLDRSGDLVSEALIVGGAGDDVVGGPLIPGTGEFFELQSGHAASALAVLDDGTALIAGWTDSPAIVSGQVVIPNAGGASGTADFFVLHVLRP